jgi:hypothetical protein
MSLDQFKSSSGPLRELMVASLLEDLPVPFWENCESRLDVIKDIPCKISVESGQHGQSQRSSETQSASGNVPLSIWLAQMTCASTENPIDTAVRAAVHHGHGDRLDDAGRKLARCLVSPRSGV